MSRQTKPAWTTSEDIKARVERVWRQGEILRSSFHGASMFPMRIHLRRPSSREIVDRFGDVRSWARALTDSDRDTLGFGYVLERKEIRNRVHGANEIPAIAVIPTERDALALIGREREAITFAKAAALTMDRQPSLQCWLARRPLAVIEHAAAWERLLGVLDHFSKHPRPGIYLRQLDIPGVDTKFIELHRRLLGELLDEVLPEQAIDRSATGVRGFSRRFGLREESPLVRFRLLDPGIRIANLTDLSLTPDEFAGLSLPVSQVFITENRTNGLAFPNCSGALVIFGLGYGLDRLSDAEWLTRVDVAYWGDIDTHGFGMLNRLRATLPSARSFLMDRLTLVAHREFWGQEPESNRYTGDTSLLSPVEQTLFSDLRSDSLGPRVRLEQERIGYRWLRKALEQEE